MKAIAFTAAECTVLTAAINHTGSDEHVVYEKEIDRITDKWYPAADAAPPNNS
jgi:hypothetical protein